MKKSKEILIWSSTLLCIYFVAWLIFTLDIFSKGKDIENNLKIALGVVFLLLCGGVIAMVHKEYDYRKYAAYISGVISVALIIQIALQGESIYMFFQLYFSRITWNFDYTDWNEKD